MTSCEFDERATKPKYVAEVDPLTTIRNKLITQSEKLETSAKFCIEYIIATFKAGICEIRVFVCRISQPLEHSTTYSFCFIVRVRWIACVQGKLKVHK